MFKKRGAKKQQGANGGVSNIPMDEYFRRQDSFGASVQGMRVGDEDRSGETKPVVKQGFSLRGVFGGSRGRTKKGEASKSKGSFSGGSTDLANQEVRPKTKGSSKSSKTGLTLGRKKKKGKSSDAADGDTSFAPGLETGPGMSAADYGDVYNKGASREFDFGNPFVVGNESKMVDGKSDFSMGKAHVPTTAMEAEGHTSAVTGAAREKTRIPKVVLELGHANSAARTAPKHIFGAPANGLQGKIGGKADNVYKPAVPAQVEAPPPPNQSPPKDHTAQLKAHEANESDSPKQNAIPRSGKGVAIRVPAGIAQAQSAAHTEPTTATVRGSNASTRTNVPQSRQQAVRDESDSTTLSVEARLKLRAKASVFKS